MGHGWHASGNDNDRKRLNGRSCMYRNLGKSGVAKALCDRNHAIAHSRFRYYIWYTLRVLYPNF